MKNGCLFYDISPEFRTHVNPALSSPTSYLAAPPRVKSEKSTLPAAVLFVNGLRMNIVEEIKSYLREQRGGCATSIGHSTFLAILALVPNR
jgi:hypothetical protein